MTATMTDAVPVGADGVSSPPALTDAEVARQLMERARTEGVKLVGTGGLVAGLTKTVLSEVGPVQITVPRDRDGSGTSQIVKKRQRRLSGVEDMVISLSARGPTTGEIQAHLAEVYDADISRQTISTITDKVIEGMAEWQNRPLDRVYPVVLIDAIVRHEAPHVRGEVGDLPRRVVAAARPKLRAA